MSTRNAWFVACGFAAVAVVLVVVASAHGIGLTPDSGEYLFGAKHLAATGEYRALSGDWQSTFPVGFPALVAVVHLLGADVETAAVIVNALAIAALVLVTFAILWRYLRSTVVVFATLGVVTIAPPLIANGSTAWSEPLFIAVTMVFLLTLTSALAAPALRVQSLCVAGLVGGATVLVRYPGLSLLPAGVLAIVLVAWHRRVPLGHAAARVGAFAATFAVIPASWMLRNVLHGHAMTGVHGDPVKGLLSNTKVIAANTTGFLLPDSIPWPARVVLVVAVVGGLLALVARRASPGIVVVTSGCVVGGYLAFCAISASLAWADVTPRVLSPVVAPTIVLLGALVDQVVARSSTRPVLALVVLGAVALGGLFAWRTADLVHDRAEHGYGFATDVWQDSPVLAAVRRTDPDALIYTTSPSATWFVTGAHPVRRWPIATSDLRGTPDVDDQDEFVRRLRCLPGGEAYLLHLDRSADERRFLPRSALADDVDLERVATAPDGTLWLAHAHGTRKSVSCPE
ncbi:MAG TPA: hypothetical protein VGN51_17945 [Acidimicrobiia bacterium]